MLPAAGYRNKFLALLEVAEDGKGNIKVICNALTTQSKSGGVPRGLS